MGYLPPEIRNYSMNLAIDRIFLFNSRGGGIVVNSGHTASPFRTTNWTLVFRARQNPADLEQLLRLYWSPVYAYVRRRGNNPADAEDVTQSFLMDVLLKRDLIGRADEARGKFRVFLMAALKNFLIDTSRRRNAVSKGPGTAFLPTDPSELRSAEPAADDDPARSFDRQWATSVFQAALNRTCDSCNRDGMERHWRVFDARVLCPKIYGCEAAPVDGLILELGVANAQEIHDMVQTVKRRIKRAIEEVIAETVSNPSEIDDEIKEVRRFLGD